MNESAIKFLIVYASKPRTIFKKKYLLRIKKLILEPQTSIKYLFDQNSEKLVYTQQSKSARANTFKYSQQISALSLSLNEY